MPTNMGQSSGQGSAKIYQFPVGGRTPRRDANRPSADFNTRLQVGAMSAGSWYHEEAIREAQPAARESQQKSPVVVPLTFPHH